MLLYFLSNYAIGLLFLVYISTEDKYSRYELTALGEIQSNTISLNWMFTNAAGDSVTETIDRSQNSQVVGTLF